MFASSLQLNTTSHPFNKAVAVAGTVVGGLILVVIPKSSGLVVGMLSWAWSGISSVWVLLQSSHPVLGWVILVLGLLALFGLIFIGFLLKELLHGKKETAGPAFQNYTEDMVDGIKWRWRWRGNQLTDLTCFCPVCDAQLVHAEGFSDTRFICERCPSDGSFFTDGSRGRVVGTVMGGNRYYAVGAIEREILRRIRTGQH